MLIKSLDRLPERFSKEEYLLGKDGNCRSVTKWSYKIVYKILSKEVIKLEIISTHKDPNKINLIK